MDLHTALLHPSPHSQYLPGHPTVNVGVWLCVGLSANMYFPKYVGFKSGILQRPHNAFIKCCVLPHQTLPLPAISSAVLPCIASHCIAFYCISLHCTSLHCILLHFVALHYNVMITLHCIALVTWSTPPSSERLSHTHVARATMPSNSPDWLDHSFKQDGGFDLCGFDEGMKGSLQKFSEVFVLSGEPPTPHMGLGLGPKFIRFFSNFF